MIYAILLAAGQSRRMGTNKLLLPLGGKPMIALIVDELQRSPVEQIFVVVNPDSSAIQQALDGRPVHFVINSDPDREMLISVRHGLRALPPRAEAVLLVLGDQPGVKAEIISQLIQAFRGAGHGIIVPTWNGRRGHPFLITRRYWDELQNAHAGQGLRGLLQAHPEDICEVPVNSSGILEDMDFPEDYQRILRYYQ